MYDKKTLCELWIFSVWWPVYNVRSPKDDFQKKWARSTDTALCWASFVCLDCKLNHYNSFCTWHQRKAPLSDRAVQAFIGSTPTILSPPWDNFMTANSGRFDSSITVNKFLNNRFWRGRRTEKAKLRRKIIGVQKILIWGYTWGEKGWSAISSFTISPA